MFTIEATTDLFIRSLKAALVMVSTDETRPHLNSLLVRVRDGHAMLVATHGHGLTVIQLGAASGSGDALLLRADVARVIKATPGWKEPGAASTRLEVTGNQARFTTATNTLTIAANVDATCYPPFEHVLPTVIHDGAAPPMSPSMISEALKVVTAFTGPVKTQGVRFYATGERDDVRSPVVVLSEAAPELTVLAMPCMSLPVAAAAHLATLRARLAGAPAPPALASAPAPVSTTKTREKAA